MHRLRNLRDKLHGSSGKSPNQSDGTTNHSRERTPPPGCPPTPENSLMMQAFEWYVPADKKHWQRLASALGHLKAIGVDLMWIPPGCKASSPEGNGYDIYDLYDLGEFDQKGSRSTKWGSKEDLMRLVVKAEEVGVGLCWDAVLNHKAAADYTEKCQAVEVDPKDRTKEISEPKQIEGWLGFNFSGRNNAYSSMKYHWYHFSGTDYNAADHKNAIYKLKGHGKDWSTSVEPELGNYDYLMFADVDYTQPDVKDDVKRWVEWIGRETRIKGMRLDAIKHYSSDFLKELVLHMDRTVGRDWFLVGEVWKDSLTTLLKYLEKFDRRISLFDVPLVYNFSNISMTKGADLTRVFEDTLVESEPKNAVTFVMNHDTQPHQALPAPISPSHIPLFYALILLRDAGLPCIFYGHLYGILGPSPSPPLSFSSSPSFHSTYPHNPLPTLCLARKHYAYGPQNSYFDDPGCVGWTREGTWDRPWGLACVVSNSEKGGRKKMFIGEGHGGEVWTEVPISGSGRGGGEEEVVIDRWGNGWFEVRSVGVAVWVNREAEGRSVFNARFEADIYRGREHGVLFNSRIEEVKN